MTAAGGGEGENTVHHLRLASMARGGAGEEESGGVTQQDVGC